jgi:hypothetical protein
MADNANAQAAGRTREIRITGAMTASVVGLIPQVSRLEEKLINMSMSSSPQLRTRVNNITDRFQRALRNLEEELRAASKDAELDTRRSAQRPARQERPATTNQAAKDNAGQSNSTQQQSKPQKQAQGQANPPKEKAGQAKTQKAPTTPAAQQDGQTANKQEPKKANQPNQPNQQKQQKQQKNGQQEASGKKQEPVADVKAESAAVQQPAETPAAIEAPKVAAEAAVPAL